MVVVAILAPAAVLAWRMRLPWRVFVALAVLALAFTGRTVFTNEVPVPLDEVVRGDPYRGLLGDVHVQNALTNDTVKQILPWMDVVRRELSHGRLPLWNPYSFAGYPLLANGQSAPFSPFFLATLFVPLPKQLVAMAALKIFVAMLFTYLVAKREGASDAAAMTASVVYAYSVFQNVYLYYPMTSVTALLPAFIYAVGEARVVWIAIVTACIAAGGHPESAAHIAIAGVLWLIVRRGSWRPFLIGGTLGMMLAAPAWMPLAEQVLTSSRLAHAARGMTPSLPWIEAWVLLSPDAFGNPARATWNWIHNYAVVAPTYLGLVPLACLLVSLRDRLAWIAIVLFVVAMNWTPLAHWLNAAPPLAYIANDRLRFVIAFFVALLTARAIGTRRMAFAIVSACLIAGFVYLHVKHPQPMLVAPVALACVALTGSQWVALAAVVAELFSVNFVFNAPVPVRYYKPRLPVLEAIPRGGEPFRIVGRDWVLMPNASAHYGLEDIRGSDPMAPRAYVELLDHIAVSDPSSDVKRVADLHQPQIDFLNVRYAITRPDDAVEGWIERYRGVDGALFENPHARSRFFSNLARVRTTNPAPARFELDIDARSPALIESSQPNMRGWVVRINGKRVPRTHGTFLTFHAPAGRSRAVITYEPVVFRIGIATALIALALLLWCARLTPARMTRRST